MKSFLKFFLASFSAIIFFILIGVVIISLAGSSEEHLPLDKPHILKLTLKGQLNERETTPSLLDAIQQNESLSVNQIQETLQNAKKDENIRAIYVQLKSFNGSIGQIENLRHTIAEVVEEGKSVYFFSDNYTQGQYYLASAGSKVFLSPNGSLDWKGLSSQVFFFSGALEKLGIDVQIIRHGTFKAAVEPFMLTKMSDANRLQSEQLINDLWSHMVGNIASSREVSATDLNRYADSLSISSAAEAKAFRLVDDLLYESQVSELVTSDHQLESSDFVSYNDYKNIPVIEKGKHRKSKIAVLYAEGDIVYGKGDDGKLGSDDLIKEIKAIRKDDKVKAVVLRVNSPGGSALASDVMWYELNQLKEKYPLIVSMGDLAASGGYYISACADTIVAEPTTITGSIGVFGMLPNMKKLAEEHIGINYDYVNSNQHSNYGNIMKPLDEFEFDKIQNSVVEVYKTFVGVVQQGRNMSFEQVDSIGQGRVWSGVSAQKIGLVDQIGTLEDAIAIAAEKAHLEEYQTVSFPKAMSFEEKLMHSFEKSTSVESHLSSEAAKYLQYLNTVQELKGIQARLPYFIEIQ